MLRNTIALGLVLGTLCFTGCAAQSDDADAPDAEGAAGVSEEALQAFCHAPQTKTFQIPRHEDVVVEAQSCLVKSLDGRLVRSLMRFSWKRSTGLGITSNHEFVHFWPETHLVRAWDRPSPDSATCNYTDDVNEKDSGSAICNSGWHVKGDWHFAGAGKIIFDIDGDDTGNQTWELTRSGYF